MSTRVEIAKVGATPKRKEDYRFVTGQGCYLDDMVFENVAHAVFLRSPHASAEIRKIDFSAAKVAPGVIAVLTSGDLDADGIGNLEPYVTANTMTGEPFNWGPQPLLADNHVRYVGEPLVMILADTKSAALDAAEMIEVDYLEKKAVVDGRAALEIDAPQVDPRVPGNLCMDWQHGDNDGVIKSLDSAEHVVSIELLNHRVITHPIEPRGGVAVYHPDGDRFTFHVSSQSLHNNRDHIAKALKIKRTQSRWLAPDVGGGFGSKNFGYQEQGLLLWAAKKSGRPVKWIATRSEVFLSDHQVRDHRATARLGLDKEGRFIALEIESIANLGAYIAGSAAGVQTNQYAHLPGTVYDIPKIAMRARSVLSNTTPIGVMRGPGFAEMVNIMERLIDKAAYSTGMDRFELRRRNLFSKTPMRNALGTRVDSGNFPKAFEEVLQAIDADGFSSRQMNSSKLRGLGVACHIKANGGSPDESASIRFRADGGVDLAVGTQTIGQGHETTFSQLLSDRLGIENNKIRLIHGDTDAVPIGGGHGSSRATYMAGTAIWRAGEEIVEQATPIAAEMLQAGTVTFKDGSFRAGDRSVGLIEVAAEAELRGNPLNAFHAFSRGQMAYPNGAQAAEVEVDPETGVVQLVNYASVDDYGVMVNPMIVEGQVAGAIAQGMGQAVLEGTIFDAKTGQPLTGSFMDYAIPRADNLPSLKLGFSMTRCTTNPFGVKGAGESGAIASYPAITLAILNALNALGVNGWHGPATPETIWRSIQDAKTLNGRT